MYVTSLPFSLLLVDRPVDLLWLLDVDAVAMYWIGIEWDAEIPLPFRFLGFSTSFLLGVFLSRELSGLYSGKILLDSHYLSLMYLLSRIIVFSLLALYRWFEFQFSPIASKQFPTLKSVEGVRSLSVLAVRS
jgi:hypothetical protein